MDIEEGFEIFNICLILVVLQEKVIVDFIIKYLISIGCLDELLCYMICLKKIIYMKKVFFFWFSVRFYNQMLFYLYYRYFFFLKNIFVWRIM